MLVAHGKYLGVGRKDYDFLDDHGKQISGSTFILRLLVGVDVISLRLSEREFTELERVNLPELTPLAIEVRTPSEKTKLYFGGRYELEGQSSNELDDN